MDVGRLDIGTTLRLFYAVTSVGLFVSGIPIDGDRIDIGTTVRVSCVVNQFGLVCLVCIVLFVLCG
jgi:hypothetical protein